MFASHVSTAARAVVLAGLPLAAMLAGCGGSSDAPPPSPPPLEVTQLGHAPGIACHTGRHSCFFQKLVDGQWTPVEPVLKDPGSIYK